MDGEIVRVRSAGLLLLLLFSLGVWTPAAQVSADEFSAPPLEDEPQIVLSRYGQFAFPLSGDPTSMWWEPRHWDGTNAVDIRANPSFGPESPERETFAAEAVVAVRAGTAYRRDNARGGIAVVLFGDDGRTYYYAHLSRADFDVSRELERGEIFGGIGNTGVWSRYLEPHLHFSVALGHLPGLDWGADIDAVGWIADNFGLVAVPVPSDAYRGDYPKGAPLFSNYRVVQSFLDAASVNPYLAGPTIESLSSESVPIRAPLTGEVRIHARTAVGVRLQITNRVSNQSVIISGDISALVRPGQVVYADMVVGAATGQIHYMYFDEGVPKDPLLR